MADRVFAVRNAQVSRIEPDLGDALQEDGRESSLARA
jgi:hypothetical protein